MVIPLNVSVRQYIHRESGTQVFTPADVAVFPYVGAPIRAGQRSIFYGQ
jgi:hypothetical protein